MKIRMLKTVETANKSYRKGSKPDIHPRKAEGWIKKGLAEVVTELGKNANFIRTGTVESEDLENGQE